ncbi:MAG: dynamin family protein, partial [Actinomycetota bacterium]|nr:dynamin family protein [Actinomycetota bacterium]
MNTVLDTGKHLLATVGDALRDQADLHDRLRAEIAGQGTEAIVVVAGEASCGKSALINALLDQSDLLPVGVEVTTNVHVVVRHGPTAGALAVVGDETVSVPIDEVALWISEAGNPGNAKAVRGMEIRLPHPLLAAGLCIVDTPGVGGLD